ncbi:MAG: hypothetical protein H0V24_00645, partial [Chloroflexia bacterium]|nr:hypothetical protein [Chloroflexia bacterium]
MFGTIGHARLKPGRQAELEALLQEWEQTIRPQIPGEFVEFLGHVAGQSDHQLFVALAQDEATYRRLAELPAQDAWFRRFAEQVDGEVRPHRTQYR